MEAQEEVIIMGSKEQTHIVKGKRTKRQRPQSPIPFAAMITADSPSGDGDGEGDGNAGLGLIDVIDNNTNLSPTSTESTEEEEDMANCLILLAQGQSRESPKQAEEDHGGVYKFNSRRFLESAAGTGAGKAGYCVYECKTCNRTFPSFQALGGHRASHKKPKAMAVEEKTKQFLLSSDDEEAQFMKKNHEISSLSLQLSSTRGLCGNNNNNINRSNKVHECSVCGAEFTSGQALGGHMRRHRAPLGTNTALSLINPPIALDGPDHQQEPKKPRHVLSLDLDLNLPAPEDDHREPKFPKQQQQQQQQQSSLVFSAPTLVDCHY